MLSVWFVVLTPREVNHCFGSVAFSGAFKKNPSVCSGTTIPANPHLHQLLLYLYVSNRYHMVFWL